MRRVAFTSVLAVLVLGLTATPALANQRPVVQSDFYSMSGGTILEVPAPGVLGNDVDPDGDPLTIYQELLPGGEVDLRPDGSFTFTPSPDSTGTFFSFDYYAFDGQIVNNCCAHVYITIYPPAVAMDDAYAALNTARLSVPSPGVLGNDTGVAVRLLTPTRHGTMQLRKNGAFTYTAAPGYVGTDSFRYRTWSGSGPNVSPPATVTIRVKASNTAPVAVADDFGTDEDTALFVEAPGVLGNDFDLDGDPLTVELVSAPRGDSFELLADGSFEYYPPADFDSPVSFQYRVFDGLAYSAVTTATIDIRFVNDPPTAVDDDFYLTARRIDVPAPGVLGNDEGDVEGDSFVAVLDTQPRYGRVRLNPDGSFGYRQDGPLQRVDAFTYHLLDSQGAVSNSATVVLSG